MELCNLATQCVKITHVFIFHSFIFLLLSSCNTTDPPSNQKITLTFEDASCTEAWLNLKIENISLPTEVKIIENDSTFLSTSINSNDTTLFVENLQPNRTYNFQVTSSQYQVSSNKVSITTMDTTSHNFTWETFTFGNRSSSLKDVAIINENNIWAVGEIHTEDTDKFDKDGNWVQSYNAVHWDGSTWELKRIFVNYRGKPNFSPLYGVFALPDGEIIFSSGLPYLPSGNSWQLYHLWDMGILDDKDGSVYSIWGTSIDNLYFVGNKGTIVHYNGSSWKKIESGTELNISSIYGIVGNNIKYCTPFGRDYGIESYLLKMDKNNNIGKEYLSTDRHFGSIWTQSGFPIYICGDGIFTNKSGTWKNDFPSNIYYVSNIGGNNLNDIITCGAYGFLAHNNGVSWKTYPIMIENSYYSVDIKEDVVAVTGFSGGKAAIVIGRR